MLHNQESWYALITSYWAQRWTSQWVGYSNLDFIISPKLRVIFNQIDILFLSIIQHCTHCWSFCHNYFWPESNAAFICLFIDVSKDYFRERMSVGISAACSTPSTRQTHKGKGAYESYAYKHSNDTQIEFRYFEHILFCLLVQAITTLLSCYVKIFSSFMID